MEASDQEHPYDSYAEAYRDWWGPVIAPAAVRLLDRLDGLVAPDTPVHLLDVGTGTGTLALAALERWPRATATGVDPSRRMLDLAAVDARRRGVDGRLRLLVGGAERLPMADASADVVLSTFVIQLVPGRAGALREMRRVLRDDGRCALLTWQASREPFEPEAVVDLTFDELDIELPEGGPDPRPYTSPEAAAAEFRRAGFRDVRARAERLEHRYTPESYVDVLEHWIEDDTFARQAPRRRAELRARLLRRLRNLPPDELVWRPALISVTARRAP
jgi:SAM-dependent methyltransferase